MRWAPSEVTTASARAVWDGLVPSYNTFSLAFRQVYQATACPTFKPSSQRTSPAPANPRRHPSPTSASNHLAWPAQSSQASTKILRITPGSWLPLWIPHRMPQATRPPMPAPRPKLSSSRLVSLLSNFPSRSTTTDTSHQTLSPTSQPFPQALHLPQTPRSTLPPSTPTSPLLLLSRLMNRRHSLVSQSS